MQSRLTVVALLGAVVLAACTSNVPPTSPATPGPTASAARSPSGAPTILATPTAALPSATPTPSPTDIGPPTLAIPDAAVHVWKDGGAAVSFGSRFFGWESTRRNTTTSITTGDLATGKSLALATLAKGHGVTEMAATTDRLIWVETWRDHPSPPSHSVPGCVDAGKPLRWRISAIGLASHAQTTLASGTNRRTAVDGECADVNPPVVAADGDRMAYTIEAPTPGKPAANRIVVRSLVDGTVIRRVQSQGLVRDLQLDGRAIAYRDLPAQHPPEAFVDPFDGTLMATTDDSMPPAEIDEHVGVSGLGGGRLAWVNTGAADGSMSTTVLGSDVVFRSLGFVAPDFVADGVEQIAVRGDLVAWIVSGLDGDIGTSRLAFWRSPDPSTRYVAGFLQPDYVGLSGGWFVWDATLSDPGVKWPAGLYGLPLAALSAH